MDGLEKTFPLARRSALVMKEMPDEILLYDLKHHQAHCLNQTAALVWQHCDGATSLTVIAQTLSQELNTTMSEAVVWVALEQLSRAHLLEQQLSKPAARASVSRRQALRKLAGMAALAPLVTSIVAPTAQAANTCLGQACTNDAQCDCTNCCNTVSGQCTATGLLADDPCDVNCQCDSGDCSGTPKKCVGGGSP